MAKKKKENRGGSGRNQGRHLKYGEETVPVIIRVPVSKVKEFRQYAALKLAEWRYEIKSQTTFKKKLSKRKIA